MITAVDTNVLLDIFLADPEHGPRSAEALRRCAAEGRLIACEVVWAEISSVFGDAARATTVLDGLGVGFDPLDREASLAAGTLLRIWRTAGGRRSRVVPDFLIGAHAMRTSSRLLSRDRGFFRSHFDGLRVLDPSAG